MKPAYIVALAACALLAFGGPSALAESPPERPAGTVAAPTLITLDNGLRVVLDEDHRSPFVGVVIRIQTGRRDDPEGRTGLADLIGDLLQHSSTRHVDRDAVGGIYRALGVPEPTTQLVTLADSTRINLTVGARALPVALWVEADRLGFFADGLCAEEITASRDRLEETLKRRQGDDYAQVNPTSFEAALGPATPYGRAFARSTTALDALDTAEVRRAIDRLYVPSNTVLGIAGDIDPVAVRALVTQTFGALVTRPRPAAPPVVASGLIGERRITMDAGVIEPMASVTWPTAPYLTDEDLTLDMVATVLAIRLDRRLVRESHRAERVASWQQSLKGGSVFTVQVRGVVGSAPEDLLRAIDQELDALRAAPLPAAELLAIQDRAAVHSLLALTSPLDRASSFVDFTLHTGDPTHLTKVIAARRAVDGEAFRRVVATQLPPGRRVVTFVRPDLSAPHAGRVVGGG